MSQTTEARKRTQAKYRCSLKGKITHAKYVRSPKGQEVLAKYDQKYPGRYKAKYILHNAVRDGLIIKPLVCSVCFKHFSSRQIQGHHPDYSKPLEVIWCCPKCHKFLQESAVCLI